MWIDPIFDRIQSDLNASSGKGYLNYDDLNRIEGNCEILKDLLLGYGYSSTTTTFKTWAMADFPYPDEIDRIRNNVKAVSNAFYTFTPEIVFYDTLKFNDVNTLEELLSKVNAFINLMLNYVRFSGTFASGEDFRL